MTNPLNSTKDRIYAAAQQQVVDFCFDENVAQVFPDMIKRSVPGYSTIVHMSGLLAEKYAQSGSRCYDLGCSLGATTLSMANQLGDKQCNIIAVDNSDAMLKRCQTHIESIDSKQQITLINSHIEDLAISNASVVAMNFTLQFIHLRDRETIIKKIYDGLLPGGILILSEKIRFEDDHLEQLNNSLHHNFKRSQGYSDLEISQKRSAIENVLIPETIAAHRQRLLNTGFNSVDVWFQCFNFMSLVAIKNA